MRKIEEKFNNMLQRDSYNGSNYLKNRVWEGQRPSNISSGETIDKISLNKKTTLDGDKIMTGRDKETLAREIQDIKNQL